MSGDIVNPITSFSDGYAAGFQAAQEEMGETFDGYTRHITLMKAVIKSLMAIGHGDSCDAGYCEPCREAREVLGK